MLITGDPGGNWNDLIQTSYIRRLALRRMWEAPPPPLLCRKEFGLERVRMVMQKLTIMTAPAAFTTETR